MADPTDSADDCPGCSVLVVDDEPTILVSLRDSLREARMIVETAPSGDLALRMIDARPFDVVVSDVRMPGLSGLHLLERLREKGCETPVILMTAYATVEQAVEATKLGAHDYVTKPFANEKVVRMVQNACSLVRLRAEVSDLRARTPGSDLDFLIGRSAPWAAVLEKVRAVAGLDSTVLIVGPSGSGKEMVANALHVLSPRRKGPFVKVHCGALPESLIENELFGHERGAFTGALRESKGRFELAHGGTLLLDEVDEMPLSSQVKLLRVIQERVVERLGGGRPVPVDVRLLATSKSGLEELARAGRFREDLYYRLSVVQLTLPTLAERPDDIPLLLAHFLTLCGRRMMRECPGFSPEAMDLLLHYPFPGNVRELQHIVESACALNAGGAIPARLLPDRVRQHARPPAPAPPAFESRPLQEVLDDAERNYLERALLEFRGTRAELATSLGISRKGLWEKLKRHGLAAE